MVQGCAGAAEGTRPPGMVLVGFLGQRSSNQGHPGALLCMGGALLCMGNAQAPCHILVAKGTSWIPQTRARSGPAHTQ